MKIRLLAALLVAATVSAAQAPPPRARAPKLIVLLMVDQMRGDYVARLQHQWTRGLRQMVTGGAWFRLAHYPYANTKTCAGHASVSTGSVPAVHGIISNNWWNRTTNTLMTCTEDPSTRTISYGAPVAGHGDSPIQLRTTTLADELQAQLSPAARVVSLSLKADAAAMLAGRHPAAAVWLDPSGAWATSSAYTPVPVPAVAQFLAQNPIERDETRTWDRALPYDAYLFEDRVVGASEPKGKMSPTFPHPLSAPGEGRVVFYERWQSSPFADEYLARMAIELARSLNLGNRSTTDLMAISFSALDKVGHDYGPNSHEVQDVLVRLDRTLGELFSGLDRLIGAGNYTVALTADHGVAPFPERALQYGAAAGRIDPGSVTRAAQEAVAAELGPGQYVSGLAHTELYFQPGVFDRLRERPAALRRVRDAIAAIEGVAEVYAADAIAARAADADAAARGIARGYFPGRSGDIIFTMRPYWLIEAKGTNHGSLYEYDTHVPVLLMGKGIVKGEYLSAAAPIDIAPTLAFLANVTLPRPSGRVLAEALSERPGPAQ